MVSGWAMIQFLFSGVLENVITCLLLPATIKRKRVNQTILPLWSLTSFFTKQGVPEQAHLLWKRNTQRLESLMSLLDTNSCRHSCVSFIPTLMSFPGDTQKPPGQSPKEHALGSLLEQGGWTSWPPKVSSNWSILWFCDSSKRLANKQAPQSALIYHWSSHAFHSLCWKQPDSLWQCWQWWWKAWRWHCRGTVRVLPPHTARVANCLSDGKNTQLTTASAEDMFQTNSVLPFFPA